CRGPADHRGPPSGSCRGRNVVVLPAALRTGRPPVRAALCETFQIPAAARILARVVDLGKRLTKAFVKPRPSRTGHDAPRGAARRVDSTLIPPPCGRTCGIVARRTPCAAPRTVLSVSAQLALQRLSRGAPGQVARRARAERTAGAQPPRPSPRFPARRSRPPPAPRTPVHRPEGSTMISRRRTLS